MIAIFRAGTLASANDLVQLTRNGTDLSSLAAYVRNEVRANLAVDQAFQCIDFHIDGNSGLPSPDQLLSRMELKSETSGGTNGFNTDSSLSR